MIKNLYIHDLQIQRKVVERLSDGSFQESWKIIANIKGRVVPASLQVQEFYAAAKDLKNVRYTVFCDVEDIQENDIILFGEKQMKVVNVREPSHMGHHLEIDCEEII